MQTKNILITGCAENLENALCLLPDPLFWGSDPFILSINTVKEYILKLKRESLLKRVGSNRNGYWEVLDEK